MSTITRSVPTITRNLRLPSRAIRVPALAARTRFAASQTQTFKQFSTMSALQSGAPPPPQVREYDPEIKDIASYVHHTPINSDLAVGSPATPQFTPLTSRSSIQHASSSSTHWVAASKD